MTKKQIAVSFLSLASSGSVQEAFESHIHPDFRHHNIYFKGDRESFRKGMTENSRMFPGKTYETLHTLEDGDLVAVHGRVALTSSKVYGVIHLFRFKDAKIIESWEASQENLPDTLNENGLF